MPIEYIRAAKKNYNTVRVEVDRVAAQAKYSAIIMMLGGRDAFTRMILAAIASPTATLDVGTFKMQEAATRFKQFVQNGASGIKALNDMLRDIVQRLI